MSEYISQQALEIGLVALTGFAVGSFLNALIHRLPRGIKFGLSRSQCPHCGVTIGLKDNIPVISYLILKAKCRSCRKPISIRYPLVESLNAGVYFWLYWYFGFSWELLGLWPLSSALIAIIFIDLEHMIIPDKITLPGIAVGLAYSLTPYGMGALNSAIGILVGGGALYLIALLGEALFKKESMGGGDIKMAAMMGAFLGWQKVILVFMLAASIGLVISIVLMAISQKFRRERMIPFGPFLATACFVALLYGDRMIDFYMMYVRGL
ncbi:MAG: prepilin peptidase [candidate division Zixibacteria bacterium]|nr:prepilin peptidase [candidate division Zixibacteria bacterium]